LNEFDLDIIANKIAEKLLIQPRWLKLKQAAIYASINVKKLKMLAQEGEVIGYSDPDSKRGDWIFDKQSLDEYRLKPFLETNVRCKEIIDKIGEYL
jgi:hypothetical protein